MRLKQRTKGAPKKSQTFTFCSQSILQNKSNAKNLHSPLCMISGHYNQVLSLKEQSTSQRPCRFLPSVLD